MEVATTQGHAISGDMCFVEDLRNSRSISFMSGRETIVTPLVRRTMFGTAAVTNHRQLPVEALP